MRFCARAPVLTKLLVPATLLLATITHAQTAWTVTNFTDTSFATLETGGGFGPGVGSGASGDLRYVLFHAMATGGVNTITFSGCSTASPCTIVLGAPLPPIFETSNISSFSLTIDGGTQGAVIIDGNSGGANTTSGALTTNRVFFVDNVAVTLKNLVIQNATAQGGAGAGGGGGGAGFGAGLFVNQSTATVVVQNSSFLNCAAIGGAGSNGQNGGGGGGLAYAGAASDGSGSSGGGGGGVSGSGTTSGNGVNGSAYAANPLITPSPGGTSGGNGGAGGGGGGSYNATGGSGGFGGGGGFSYNATAGSGGFGGGGGGGYYSGNGGFGGGGGGGCSYCTQGSGGGGVGGVTGGNAHYGGGAGFAGGGGAAAGPAIFVVNGSVTLYNVTGSGFTATGGQPTNNNAGAGTANSTAVFNYGGTVNGSKSVGPVNNAFTVTEPVGTTSATQTATLTYTSSDTPTAVHALTLGTANLDFNFVATATPGTCDLNVAATAGTTCTVAYTFTPQHPGVRYGAITLTNGSGSVIASTLVSGVGTGPQVVFNAPLTPSTLGGGFGYPTGVAVDGSGNVYVADSGNGAVKVMANTCTSSSCVSTLGGGFSYPYGVAVDGSGNVYVADTSHNAVKVMANICTSSSCVSTLGGGFSYPYGVAVDGSGNVYVADTSHNAVKMMANICTSSSCVNTLGGGFSYPQGVTVDGSGNVYVTDTGHSAVKMMANTCTSSSCVSTLGGGFNIPYNVAVDGSGNVYVADYGHNAVKQMSNTCTSSTCVTTLGSGFSNPAGVAMDGSGNVYVADAGNNAVKVMARPTPPTVAFTHITTDGTTDSTDGTQTVTVQNIGNATLSFPIPGSGVTNPTTPHDFTFTTTGGSACPSLTSSASTTGTLAAGATCNIPLTFTPVLPANGALSESLIFTDTNLNATSAAQTITLIGTAVLVPYAITHFNGYVTNIALGSTTNFLIFLGNPSSTAALSNVSATVTLPAGFSYAGSTGGGCNVTPSSSGSTVTLSGISLGAGGSCQNGINLTATQLGSQTVSTLPAAGTANGTAATTSVTVYTPTLTSLTVSGYGSPAILTEGSTVTVTAYDQNSNVDTSFTGTVTLSSSDAKATLPGSYAFQSSDNGVHTFNVTLNTLGSQYIKATSGSVSASQSGILVGDALWVLSSNGTLNKLNTQGGAAVTSISTPESGQSGGVAFDSAGGVWSVNSANNTLAFSSAVGSNATVFSGGGLTAPVGVAVDGLGTVWVANSGGNSVSVFSNAGSAQTNAGGYFGMYLSGPSSVVLDASGGVWVTDKSANAVTHVFGAAAPVVTPISSAIVNRTQGTEP